MDEKEHKPSTVGQDTADGPDTLAWEEQRCPTCGYVVYSLQEARCPECGKEFTWAEVRAAALSRRGDLFEHRWREDFGASLVRTWARAIWSPRQFWTRYTLEDAPRVVPLLVLILLQWLIFARGWHLLALAADPVMNSFDWLRTAPARGFVYVPRMSAVFLEDMALWYFATFLSMLLFYRSSRRAGVRWRHILRVYAHATLFASLYTVLCCIAEVLVDVTLLIKPGSYSILLYAGIDQAIYGVGLLLTWVYLWIGYRCYLGIPHGWAIAGLSLWLGRLTMETLRLYI
ncbi:MAG: hypothetical protein GY842_03335 [bacterium]|nr:hypothetical protein [bacterium]